MKKALWCLLLGFMSAGYVAHSQADGPGWTANSIITKLVVTGDGSVNVKLSPNVNNCVSVAGYGPNWASVYANHPAINRIAADLLAAYMGGKTVALYLQDNTCKVTEIMLGGW